MTLGAPDLRHLATSRRITQAGHTSAGPYGPRSSSCPNTCWPWRWASH